MISESASGESSRKKAKKPESSKGGKPLTEQELELRVAVFEARLLGKLKEWWQKFGGYEPSYENVRVKVDSGRISASVECLICNQFRSLSVVDNTRVSTT